MQRWCRDVGIPQQTAVPLALKGNGEVGYKRAFAYAGATAPESDAQRRLIAADLEE